MRSGVVADAGRSCCLSPDAIVSAGEGSYYGPPPFAESIDPVPDGITFRNVHHHGFEPQQLAVAWDQRPDRRTRRAFLHLSYSCSQPCGPTTLVTHDPHRTLRPDRPAANGRHLLAEGAG